MICVTPSCVTMVLKGLYVGTYSTWLNLVKIKKGTSHTMSLLNYKQSHKFSPPASTKGLFLPKTQLQTEP